MHRLAELQKLLLLLLCLLQLLFQKLFVFPVSPFCLLKAFRLPGLLLLLPLTLLFLAQVSERLLAKRDDGRKSTLVIKRDNRVISVSKHHQVCLVIDQLRPISSIHFDQ